MYTYIIRFMHYIKAEMVSDYLISRCYTIFLTVFLFTAAVQYVTSLLGWTFFDFKGLIGIRSSRVPLYVHIIF